MLYIDRVEDTTYSLLCHNGLYGHALAQETCTGGHEIYNFGRPFLGHHYYTHLFCLKHMPLSREEDFLRNTSLYSILHRTLNKIGLNLSNLMWHKETIKWISGLQIAWNVHVTYTCMTKKNYREWNWVSRNGLHWCWYQSYYTVYTCIM